eukprot:1270805-Amphidinium_carterae.1
MTNGQVRSGWHAADQHVALLQGLVTALQLGDKINTSCFQSKCRAAAVLRSNSAQWARCV